MTSCVIKEWQDFLLIKVEDDSTLRFFPDPTYLRNVLYKSNTPDLNHSYWKCLNYLFGGLNQNVLLQNLSLRVRVLNSCHRRGRAGVQPWQRAKGQQDKPPQSLPAQMEWIREATVRGFYYYRSCCCSHTITAAANSAIPGSPMENWQCNPAYFSFAFHECLYFLMSNQTCLCFRKDTSNPRGESKTKAFWGNTQTLSSVSHPEAGKFQESSRKRVQPPHLMLQGTLSHKLCERKYGII